MHTIRQVMGFLALPASTTWPSVTRWWNVTLDAATIKGGKLQSLCTCTCLSKETQTTFFFLLRGVRERDHPLTANKKLSSKRKYSKFITAAPM